MSCLHIISHFRIEICFVINNPRQWPCAGHLTLISLSEKSVNYFRHFCFPERHKHISTRRLGRMLWRQTDYLNVILNSWSCSLIFLWCRVEIRLKIGNNTYFNHGSACYLVIYLTIYRNKLPYLYCPPSLYVVIAAHFRRRNVLMICNIRAICIINTLFENTSASNVTQTL